MGNLSWRGTMFAPKAFYFCWFVAQGAFIPFLSLYYRSTGLDLAQIGLLIALPGLIQIVATPLWGVLADALRLHRILLPLTIICTVVPIFFIGRSNTFVALLPLVAALAIFTAPIIPLADSATLASLGTQRERYGRQRVWGAVGWIISAFLFGMLFQSKGPSVIFLSYLLLGPLTALVAATMPRAELPRVHLQSAARTLLHDRRWAIFLGCILLIGCANGAIQGFLPLYLQDLGAGGEQIGLAISFGSVTELPVMLLAPLVLRRWGARPLLVTSGLLFALRAITYVFAPSYGWALAVQVLHGPCFAALYVGGVDEAQRLAPRGLETTAQSLFGTMLFGIAAALANAVGGRIYQDFGSATLFSVTAVVALLGVLGVLTLRERPAQAALRTVEERR